MFKEFKNKCIYFENNNLFPTNWLAALFKVKVQICLTIRRFVLGFFDEFTVVRSREFNYIYRAIKVYTQLFQIKLKKPHDVPNHSETFTKISVRFRPVFTAPSSSGTVKAVLFSSSQGLAQLTFSKHSSTICNLSYPSCQ